MDFTRPPGEWPIDLAHNAFLFGSVLARKPHDVLELGIGLGYVTRVVLAALKYNGRGRLVCVENWSGWGGREHEVADLLRKLGAEIVVGDERVYVEGCPDDSYDLLISDADHDNSHLWLEGYLRITRHDGFMFFHDTNNIWPGLRAIEDRIKHMPYFHFKESTRPDEECERGWLFVVNKKY